MKVLILLILTQSYRISNGENSEKIADTRLQRHEHEVNECENIKEEVCSLCLQIPGCAWCTLKDYEHARCDKETNHINLGCPKNHTINPTQNVTVDKENLVSASQIFPKKVTLTARVGEPVTFTVNVRPAKNYPVDLYFLVDLSKTMQDDLGNLKLLAGNICKCAKFSKSIFVPISGFYPMFTTCVQIAL